VKAIKREYISGSPAKGIWYVIKEILTGIQSQSSPKSLRSDISEICRGYNELVAKFGVKGYL